MVLGAIYGEPPVEGDWADLRIDGARLSARDAGLFAEFLGLANWHRVAGFSPRTGAPTVVGRGGWVRHPQGFESESTGEHNFPRTDAAVIMGVVDGQDRLLLARNQAWPEPARLRARRLRGAGRVVRVGRAPRGAGGGSACTSATAGTSARSRGPSRPA